MDKLLIILKKEGIRLYDIDGSKTKIHLIRGEEETDTEEYAEVAESLRDSYNDDELSEVELDLLYTNGDTEIVKGFTEELLPCGGWQVFSFKKILPEILLKNNMLKPNESVTVQYDGEAYTASMTKNGEIELTAAESGTELHDSDIAAIYANKFNVFADEEKQEKLQHQIKEFQQECEKKDNELKQVKAEQRHTKEELQKADNIKRELFKELRITIIGNSEGKLNWKKNNGDFVKEGELLATGASGSWYEYAGGSGILVHIAESGADMNNNVIGVIMHKDDSMEEARKWAAEYMKSEDSTLPKDYKEKRRMVYSTINGSITWKIKPMDYVKKDQVIATGGESQLIAPISGCFIGVNLNGISSVLRKTTELGTLLGVFVDKNELRSGYREDLEFWLRNDINLNKKIQPVCCPVNQTIYIKGKPCEKIKSYQCIAKIVDSKIAILNGFAESLNGLFSGKEAGKEKKFTDIDGSSINANFDGILHYIKKLETKTDKLTEWSNPFDVDKLIAILVPEDMHMDELLAFKKGYKDERTDFDMRAEEFFSGSNAEE